MRRLILAVPFFALWTIGQAWAEDAPQTAQGTATTVAGEKGGDPLDLPPGEFFNLDLSVYSPAKKLQKLKNTASATYVLTAEDIRRSGATNLVELFRLMPGIEVAQVSSHEFAITSRGFNQVFGNKILLLVDNAPVETPIFNGILWENINIPLDTIERIEFVRGPGAATWGTRAMNGLINVITKDAFTAPHNVASFGGGSEHQADVYARAGKVLSDTAAVQSYVKVDTYDNTKDSAGNKLNDDWSIVTGHMRGDFKPSEEDSLRAIGDLSFRQADFQLGVPTTTDPYLDERDGQRQNNRASLAVLWQRELPKDAQLSVEWTNQYERRNDFLLDLSAFYSELEARHRFSPFEGNEFAYGLNFRFYTDETAGSETLHFEPANRSLDYYRLFFQDEIKLIENVLVFTIGSRFEQNEEVGFNALPTARLVWSPTERVSFWGAVSYTEGSPSRVYDDLHLNVAAFQEPTTGLPAIVQVTGNRGLQSEQLTAYEIGTWLEPMEKFYTSATVYYFHYNNIVNNVAGDPIPVLDDPNGPYLLVPFSYANGLNVDSIGAELAADWSVTDWFNFAATYSHINSVSDGSDDSTQSTFPEDNPKQSFSVQGHFTFNPFEIDTILRYVAELPKTSIDGYLEGDLRLGWHATQKLEFEIIGRNLFHDRHEEFAPVIFQTPLSEVERSVFIRANYTF